MNHSETAFAFPVADDTFTLRWFTPMTEVPLCGHATLATAFVLHREGVMNSQVFFETASGRLMVEPSGDALAMTMPRFETEQATAPQLVAALGVNAIDTRVCKEAKKLLVIVASEDEVIQLRPNVPALLSAANPLGVLGVIITAQAKQSSPAAPHFVSRYLAPWVGIAEDPVTGSAHSVLGPYWAERLGRKKMLAAQRSPRGGDLGVEVQEGSVVLTGSCVMLSRGFLLA